MLRGGERFDPKNHGRGFLWRRVRLKTTAPTTFSTSRATQRLTRWWPGLPTISPFITAKAVREGARLCKLHLSGQQLETAAQSGGAAGVLIAGGRGWWNHLNRHPPRSGHPLRRRSLKGSAQRLYEKVCGRQRGQMEHLIKLHKAQTGVGPDVVPQARPPIRCGSPSTPPLLVSFIPQTDPLAEFGTIRERLIKIGARVTEHLVRIRI